MPFPCIRPYAIKKGDVLRLTSVYGPRTLLGGYPWHAGVMGLVFLAGHTKIDVEEQCLNSLHQLCGSPIYKSKASCLDCAKNGQEQLKTAGCTVAMVEKECEKNNDGGNIPPPDEVNGMSLHVTSGEKDSSKLHVNLTCPYTSANPWCMWHRTQLIGRSTSHGWVPGVDLVGWKPWQTWCSIEGAGESLLRQYNRP